MQNCELEELTSSDDFEEVSILQGRYFGRESDVLCFYCGLPGHVSRECPDKANRPCFLCSERGHARADCPQDCCYNCGKPGHISKNCKELRKRRIISDICHTCNIRGHLQVDCPLNWRKYLFNRNLVREELYNSSRHINRFCFFCSLEGHFGDECPYRQPSVFSIFHSPVFELLVKANLNDQKTQQEKFHSSSYSGSYRRFKK